MNRLVFGIILLGLMGYAVAELVRYVLNQGSDDPNRFPYPRARLNRRMGVFALMSAAVMLLFIVGEGRLTLPLLLAELILILLAFRLLFQDLRETTRASRLHRSMIKKKLLEEVKREVRVQVDDDSS